jgi:SAM-dependent methyltransferase
MKKKTIPTKWNPLFDNKPTSNIPRISFSKKFSTKYLEERDQILEIGCGVGSFTHLIDRKGYFALDLDINAIKIAKKYCINTNFIVASALNLPLRSEIFDLICMWGVFEEIPMGTENQIVSEIHRTLKSKAILLLSIYGDHFITKILDPAFIFRGVRHYNLQEFRELISNYGLLIGEITVRGGLNTVISNFLVYFYKHVLKKKEGTIKNYFDKKSSEEIDSGKDGMVYIFIAARKQ